MPVALRVLLRPRHSLRDAADHTNLASASLVVVLTALLSLTLDGLAARIAPTKFAAPAASSFAVIPLLLLGFWVMAAWLVDRGARLMAVPGQRRRLLALTGQCFGVLAGYGLVGVLQALTARAGGGDGLLSAVGVLAFIVIIWFTALLGVAITTIYDLEPPSALALALLPFAAVSAAVLVFIVVISALHAAGAV